MTVEIKPREDILLPRFRLIPHAHGGWALPGGGVAYDVQEAVEIARRMDKYLESMEPYDEGELLRARLAAMNTEAGGQP